MRIIITETQLKNIIVNNDLLNEFELADLGHWALDIGGLIPGIGDAVDIAHALWYFKLGEKLLGTLTLISAIPVVGSVIGVGAKLFIKGLEKASAKILGKIGATSLEQVFKHPDKLIQFIKYLEKESPELAKQFKDLMSSLSKNSSTASGLINKLKQLPYVGAKITGVDEFFKLLTGSSKILEKELPKLEKKRIGKMVKRGSLTTRKLLPGEDEEEYIKDDSEDTSSDYKYSY